MNYIEWALQRGAELWRAREEALKKRLSLVPEGTAQKKAAEAQLSEEEAAAQDAEAPMVSPISSNSSVGNGPSPTRVV